MFLESGIAGVKARSVNENEPCPTSCLGRVTPQWRGPRDREKERSGRREEGKDTEVRGE